MAATPTLNSSPGPGISWPPDSQPSGPGTNGSAKVGPLAGDHNDSGRDPENLDYPRATSMSEGEPYREKQVKVLRLFCCLVFAFLFCQSFHAVRSCPVLVEMATFKFSGDLSLALCSTFLFSSCLDPVFTLLSSSQTRSISAVCLNTLARKIYRIVSAKLAKSLTSSSSVFLFFCLFLVLKSALELGMVSWYVSMMSLRTSSLTGSSGIRYSRGCRRECCQVP